MEAEYEIIECRNCQAAFNLAAQIYYDDLCPDCDRKNAAAALFARQIEDSNLWYNVEHSDVNRVRWTIRSAMLLSNFKDDYDFDVVSIAKDEFGTIRVAARVHAVREDHVGYALPTHAKSRTGAFISDEMPRDVRLLATRAGMDLDRS